MAGFTAGDYNSFLQGKNVGSAEAARVQQWAQSQGYTGNVQSAAGIKNVNSANDIRQMVDAVNAWGNARNQQAAATAAAQQAEWQRQAAAQQAEWQRQAAARQWQWEQDAAAKKAAEDAAAQKAGPPPPPPGGPPPGGQPPAEQPNSAGSYNSQLVKAQLEQQAQSKAAENSAAMAYQRPQTTPVVASGGDRYQESVRPPAATFTPAAPPPRPPQGPGPQGHGPQGHGPQGQGPTLPPQQQQPQQAVPPSQRAKGLAALGVTLSNAYGGKTPIPAPQVQAPVPGAPAPLGPVPQAPVPQAPVPQAPPPVSQVPASSPDSSPTPARRFIPREPARPTEGYGTRDSQAQGGTYSGSQAWRNFWNPSASALNTSAPAAPAAYEENATRRWRREDPAATRGYDTRGYATRGYDTAGTATGGAATGGSGRRMAGDRFRFTRA